MRCFRTQDESGCGAASLRRTYTKRTTDESRKKSLEKPQSRRERPARGPLRLNDQAVPSKGLASRVSATVYWVYDNRTELVGPGVVVGYQWFEVRIRRDHNLTIPLHEHEELPQGYAKLLTQIEAVPPGFRTRPISGHTLFQFSQ